MEHPATPPSPQEACGRQGVQSGLCPASPLTRVTLWNTSSCYSPAWPREQPRCHLGAASAPCPPAWRGSLLPGSPPQACHEPAPVCSGCCLAAPGSPDSGPVCSEATLRLLLSQCILSSLCFSSLPLTSLSCPLPPSSVFCIKAPRTSFPLCPALWLPVQLFSFLSS